MGGVSDRPIFDIGIVEDDPTPDRDLQGLRRTDRRKEPNDKRRGLILAGIAIAVAVGALVLVPILTSGDDEAVDGSELPTA